MERIKNWTGTVHWAAGSYPACGRVRTHSSYFSPTTEQVTCNKCIARYGLAVHVAPDAPIVQEHVARRAAERAARRAARMNRRPA